MDKPTDTVAFVQHWLMNADHDPSQFDRDFAAAIDARVTAVTAKRLAEVFCATPLPDDVCADPCATVQGQGRYGTHLLTVAQAEQVFAAILSTPSPDSGERMREALEPFAGVAVGEVWKHFSAENPTLRISSSDGSRHLTFVSAEWFERAAAALQESAR